MPDRTETIISGDDARLIRMLQEDVQTLERLGAANIAIPCNTSYYYFDQMQSATKVPIIHMIKESVIYGVEKFKHVRKIGIMGTDGTINAGIYDEECRRVGVQPIHPSPEKQRAVMHIIYNEIKKGHHGSETLFNSVLQEFIDKGCDVVILACTELSVYKQYHQVPDFCLDAMDVLIRESIIRSNAVYKSK